MTTVTTSAAAAAALEGFERTTSRWGRITMIAGLLLSLAGPAYLFLFADLDITWGQIVTAFLAVMGTFGVFWVLEPVTYFPILGPAAMYQAFMIGNISNKLLPAAIVAQSSTDSKPGTARGNLAAVMAICGAATVHLTSLLLFVGIFGTWLVAQIPESVTAVSRTYILPSLLGAVLVQAIVAMRNVRATIWALGLAIVIEFIVITYAPGLAPYATAICVGAAMIGSWFTRQRDVGQTGIA